MHAKAHATARMEIPYIRAYAGRYWKLRGWQAFETHVQRMNRETYIASAPDLGFVLLSPTPSPTRTPDLLERARREPRPRRTLRETIHDETTGTLRYIRWRITQ